MSVKSLFMMIFMVIVFPIVIVFHNADAFFIIMSLILLFMSIGSLNTLMIPQADAYNEEELESEEVEDVLAEIGETIGINTRKLGYGFIIALDLMIIIYFLYSFLILDVLLLKAIAIVLIADWIYDIVGVIDNMLNNSDYSNKEQQDNTCTWKDRLYELYLWGHNITTIGFIIVTFFLKFIV